MAQLGKVSQAWKTGNMKSLEAMCSDEWSAVIGTCDTDCGVPFMGEFEGACVQNLR